MQNRSFWLIFWVLFQNLSWAAQPAGTIQYFTERVSNTIETSKYTFGDRMSPLRLPADFQILVVDKKREKKQKNVSNYFLKQKFLQLRFTNVSNISEVC